MPLPSDISIGTPAADVRAADAAFSGAWGNGAWYGGRPTALIVERVDADGSAHLIYAVGAWAYPNAAEWQRIVGHIKDGRLGFHLPDRNSYAGCQMEYRMVAPGALEGDATNGHGWRGDAFLQCIAGPPSTIVATVALPYRRIWRQIWMAERSPKEGDQPVKLEATLYRTRLPGRQPLVILNHGSQELHEKYTARFKAGSRFFLGRGYSVVVPMRRGYGRSGGPLGMGSDGAVEDLDAVVDNMRAKPWVDPARIIVGGWSRGGLLSIV